MSAAAVEQLRSDRVLGLLQELAPGERLRFELVDGDDCTARVAPYGTTHLRFGRDVLDEFPPDALRGLYGT